SVGASVKAVDVCPTDWNVSIAAARATVSHRTRAIVAVNSFGAPADVNGLRGLRVPLIEDFSHGGSVVDNARFRSEADTGVVSFYASKLIGAGEGGAVLLRDGAAANRLRAWRDYADQGPDGRRLNEKMTDIEAALALCQLDRLQKMLRARSDRADAYQRALRPLAQMRRVLLPAAVAERAWYRYVIAVPGVPATRLVAALRRRGVGAALPVDPWVGPGFPVADAAFDSLVSIPLYPTLSDDEQATVCAALKSVIEEVRLD
ncbi:MAG TPA: DegT/DnrJ/EryC1/StrS aminotransferase family protein, partial [Burkholderiaceae bacterium]|nr:DegT/DnrJ/EryC1/StrS aminotransferase family protein [Burkholderiaceae bacterium]